jgi:hypothetical protein
LRNSLRHRSQEAVAGRRRAAQDLPGPDVRRVFELDPLSQTPSNTGCEKRLTEKVAVDTATIGCLSRELDVYATGLKKLLQDGEELPKIYQDPTFAESSNWILSTSQLSVLGRDREAERSLVDRVRETVPAVGDGSVTPAVKVLREFENPGADTRTSLRHRSQEAVAGRRRAAQDLPGPESTRDRTRRR